MNLPIVNIINLERRIDRKVSLLHHLHSMNIPYQLWKAHEDPHQLTYYSVTASHKAIVEDAKREGRKYVVVGEDDMRFSHPDAYKYFIENMPEDFDLYLGMIYCGQFGEEPNRIINSFVGMQFYSVHERFFDEFLSCPADRHIDMWLSESCHLFKYYTPEYFVAYGEAGWSDNFKRNWSHDPNSLPRPLFNGIPQTI